MQKYKREVSMAMERLAFDDRTVFIGYNVKRGSQVYGTLTSKIPMSQRIETPVAENLMAGIATGMAIEGYRPVLIFERHDFLFNALDQLVNHLDKIEEMSNGQYKPKVIIRAIVGARYPLYAGLQHTQDYSLALKQMFRHIPIFELHNAREVSWKYRQAMDLDRSVIMIEKRDFYDRF